MILAALMAKVKGTPALANPATIVGSSTRSPPTCAPT